MATIAIGVDRGPSDYTCRVPLEAISESGVPPEEGDSVQYEVSGTVHDVTADSCTVSIESINGEPVGSRSDEGGGPTNEPLPPENAAAMGTRLKKAARGLPLP